MALRATDVIDAMGVDDASGHMDLILVDEETWKGEAEHLRLLQEKLNAYLRFVESGEVVENYPESAKRAVRIRIHFRFAPTPGGRKFLREASSLIGGAGMVLMYRIHPSEKWVTSGV